MRNPSATTAKHPSARPARAGFTLIELLADTDMDPALRSELATLKFRP